MKPTMKVLIPKWAETLEDEPIIVFLAFMLRMSLEDTNRTRYYMQLADIRYFVGGYIMIPDAILDRIPPRKIRLGSASDSHWLFEWEKQPNDFAEYDLQDPRSVAIWCYLLGREVNSGPLVEENLDGRIPCIKQKSVIKTEEDLQFFDYISNRDRIKLAPKTYDYLRDDLTPEILEQMRKYREETGASYKKTAEKFGFGTTKTQAYLKGKIPKNIRKKYNY